MKNYLAGIILALIVLLFANPVSAQTGVPKSAPFAVNENLVYEVKFSKAILRGLAVGEFRFKVLATPENNPAQSSSTARTQNFRLQGEAISKGSLVKLFRQNINIKIESTVSGTDFAVVQSNKTDQQNARLRNSKTIFNYADKKLTFTETNPSQPANPPRMITATLEGATQDIVSAIYAMRRLPLAVGKSFELAVSDTGVVYNIPLKVEAREQIKTDLGKFWTFRIVPDVFGERGLVQGNGDMTIWITDDNRRLPVRSRINANIGRVEIRIKTAENLVAPKN